MSLEPELSLTVSLPWSPELSGVSAADRTTELTGPTHGAEVLGSAAAAAAEALEGTQTLVQLNQQ